MVCRTAVIDITARKRADELAAANQALETEIAARKRAERALNASLIETQYQAETSRAAAETIRHLARLPAENPNPVLRIARDGTILYANPVSGPLLACWNLPQGKGCPQIGSGKLQPSSTRANRWNMTWFAAIRYFPACCARRG